MKHSNWNRLTLTLVAIFGLTVTCFTVQALAQDNPPTLDEIVEAWMKSSHADLSSEAFTHWNEDGEIPGNCAVCHSSTGAIGYLKGPMSTPGIIDNQVKPGTNIGCAVCHNQSATELSAVPFPSGVTVESFGKSAICSVCHQGRASGKTVAVGTSDLDEDVISADLSFVNVHYAPSAATIMGSVVNVGYEYPNKIYKGQFTHVPGLNTCTSCHNPHALTVELNSCTSCHRDIETFKDIRISPMDFDGDGNSTEGIADPIVSLQALLGSAIQRYASEVIGTPVIYANSYPYFFTDTDADGAAGPGEAIYPNRYQKWTPRLLKVAYNYQLIAKEKAIYTHNPHYALQLLYDSLESLSERVEVDMDGLIRP